MVPLAASWDGTTWSVVDVPNSSSNGFFNDVSCTSPTSCMAVGDTYACAPITQGGGTQIVCLAPDMLVESWDGTNWSIDTTPDENGTDSLSSVSCVAATRCVAMGASSNTSTGADEALVESWNGTSWFVAYGPTLSGTQADADSVSCISFTNCSGVGFSLDPSPGVQEQTLALSWDGTTSSVVPTADPSSTFDEFDGVSCAGATFCAGVGSTQSPFPSTPQPLVETWNGSSWSVAPTATTTVVLPSSSGAALGGTGVVLDATASASAGVASVQFTLTGGADNQTVIGTATPTIYGHIFVWNTKAVPDGTYTLQSLVTDGLGHAASSSGVSVTVDNTPPTTTVIIPSAGAGLQGTSAILDATASAPDGVKIAQVQFTLTGGPDNQTVIGTATPTIYGYLFAWNTTTVPNGSYAVASLAIDAAGNTAVSSAVSITVANPPPITTVIIPSAGASLQGTSAILDATASASNGLKVAKVEFTLIGAADNERVIGTATPTIYGYLFAWNTTTVPNGTYAVGSRATDIAGNSASSVGVSLNVNN